MIQEFLKKNLPKTLLKHKIPVTDEDLRSEGGPHRAIFSSSNLRIYLKTAKQTEQLTENAASGLVFSVFETNLRSLLFSEHFVDGIENKLYAVSMIFYALFDFTKPFSKLLMAYGKLSHAYKSPHDLNVDVNSDLARQNSRKHGYSLLCKGIR